ncbi:ABC transporter permease [Xanthomonas citri pv. fuscans CFBP 6996]|uniref:ABC transporter permease n=1 Tax=Xanthomonas citri TaxID=346 RepID=UPI000C17480D|nr:ABC transporter permease [Xanthomonas citri]ATS50609.1 ABC transporter permease [Xanthomonas citri pv. phaseoli var. fuscans]ATS56343.1 ABC transporter permease [Xanthomonas citri pv. phaseoli var. fuscans]ATS59647.1 ABC transporter permease [Xanthomonas citri pv. phaseoli var. fuscans]PTY31282.1 ABC transporter permease [Xanthomonas citri pv. fuscans CFBP 6996]QWN15217.1 ABC transporter permease [Xanthomonas citri]
MNAIASGRFRHAPWLGQLRSLATHLLGAALVLWAAATLLFLVLRLMPGDPALAILGGSSANPTAETLAAVRREYGLDQPLLRQYVAHLGRLVHGDLGTSYSQHLPVVQVLREQAGATLQLTGAALLLAWLLALASVLPSVRRGWRDRLFSTLETVAAALPQFWLGLVLLAVFAFGLRVLPPAGSDGLRSLILPALTLALPLAGFLAQVTRESMALALEQPFVLSARTRGLGEGAVRLRHALRHALLPGLSLSGWAIGATISGAVVTEVIFSRKGVGRQLFYAVQAQDLPLAMGIVLFIAAVYVIANLSIDALQRLVDPRLSGESR